MSILSYIPFLYPLQSTHHWWYLLMVPLAFGVSMIYKAVRMQSLEPYWRHVTIMTVQVVAALIGLAIALAILVQFVIPMLPAD